MLVEVQGSQILARIDDSHVGFGEQDGINVDKNDFGMPVSGDSASLRSMTYHHSTDSSVTGLLADSFR